MRLHLFSTHLVFRAELDALHERYDTRFTWHCHAEPPPPLDNASGAAAGAGGEPCDLLALARRELGRPVPYACVEVILRGRNRRGGDGGGRARRRDDDDDDNEGRDGGACDDGDADDDAAAANRGCELRLRFHVRRGYPSPPTPAPRGAAGDDDDDAAAAGAGASPPPVRTYTSRPRSDGYLVRGEDGEP